MTRVRLIAVSLGAALLLGLMFLTLFGVPAGPLVASLTRQVESQSDLRLRFSGPVKLALWPSLGVTAENVGLRQVGSNEELFAAKRVRFGVSLTSLMAGHIRVTDVALVQAIVRLGPGPDRKSTQRAADAAIGPLPEDSLLRILAIEHLSVDDCRIIVHDERETVEAHVDSIRVTSSAPSQNRLDLKIDLQSGARRVRLETKADQPARFLEGGAIPVQAALEVEGISPVRMTANLQALGPVLKVDALAGTIDRGRVSGAISVSFAGSKPFIDANLESDSVDLTQLVPEPAESGRKNTGPSAAGQSAAPLWSDKRVSLLGLHLLEADVRIAAREVWVHKVHIAPASLEATLLQDTLSVTLPRAQLYGGQADGALVLDASKRVPELALRLNLAGLDALPFLGDAFDFHNLEGRAQARVDVKAAGDSPLRVVSSLQGTTQLLFEDGAVRGLNIPDMVRSLMQTVLSGWQEKQSERTKFSAFSASFQIENGRAHSEDVRFLGPFVRLTAAGTADIAAQTLDFRADPKLVLNPEGQGGRVDSWGIGVPVAIRGTWSEPRIYPELPDILSNPEAALAKLRDMGKGMPGLPDLGKGMPGLPDLGKGMPAMPDLGKGMPAMPDLGKGMPAMPDLGKGLPGLPDLGKGTPVLPDPGKDAAVPPQPRTDDSASSSDSQSDQSMGKLLEGLMHGLESLGKDRKPDGAR
jgi:AsmA protein